MLVALDDLLQMPEYRSEPVLTLQLDHGGYQEMFMILLASRSLSHFEQALVILDVLLYELSSIVTQDDLILG